MVDTERRKGYLDPYRTPESMNEIAHLCRVLGIYFDASYHKNKKHPDKNSTSILSSKPIKWLPSIGLRATPLKKYNEEDIINGIKNGNPIYAGGNTDRTRFLFLKIYSGGHGWVYDGYIKATKGSEQRYLVHCNWGWNGLYNGYFLSYAFDTKTWGQIRESEVTRGKKKDGFYRFNLEYSIISR